MSAGKNGGGAEVLSIEAIVRLVATLQVSQAAVVEAVKALKSEIKAELRAVGGKIDVLAGRVDALTERVHKAVNVATKALEETAALHQSQLTLDRALDFFEAQQKVKGYELERAQKALEGALELVEARVRQVRDDVADLGFESEGEG